MNTKIQAYNTHRQQREIYWKTKCNIDCPITNERRGFRPYQKMRMFEIPACGGVLLTAYSDEFVELFEPEKEMFFYKSKEEAVDKAMFIMNNYYRLCDMRINAYKRAVLDHQFIFRFRAMLRKLKGRI